MAPTQKPKKRSASVGALTVTELPNGDVELGVNLELQEGTSPKVIQRIRSIIAGLAYSYDKDSDRIEIVGQAYLEGIEYAQENAAEEKAQHDESRPKIGFRSV